jgi:hypothetical protein
VTLLTHRGERASFRTRAGRRTSWPDTRIGRLAFMRDIGAVLNADAPPNPDLMWEI